MKKSFSSVLLKAANDNLVECIETADPYLRTDAMQATLHSLALLSNVLRFELVEIWASGSDGVLHCICMNATNELKKNYPNIVTAHYPYDQGMHKRSPKVRFAQLFYGF